MPARPDRDLLGEGQPGNPISLVSLKTLGRLSFVLAGPTEPDYGYTKFPGPAVTTNGYVSEDGTNGTCDSGGTCTYTFLHSIPADAKGTFTIGMEGRRAVTILPGTARQTTTNVGAINKVMHFSVDGSPVKPRRQVVSIDKCNMCHQNLTLHGENRNQIEQCVLCHNPSETDGAVRGVAVVPAERLRPAQSIDMKYMIHRIHTGEELKAMGVNDFVVLGRGGSQNDFGEVLYPAFSPSGAPGDRRNCAMCHVNGTENNLPTGRLDVLNPQAPISPMGSVTTTCTGCHATIAAASHALANTTRLGESCAACHSSSSEFSVTRSHAR